MRYLGLVFTLAALFTVPSPFASAQLPPPLAPQCPGSSVILNFNSSNVNACNAIINPINAIYPVEANTTGSITINNISSADAGEYALTCDDVTRRATLTVASGAQLQACCGFYDLAGTVWNGSACVASTSVPPPAPAWIVGSCIRP